MLSPSRGDDALPLFAVFGLQRQGENAVFAQEIGQAFVRADFGLFVPAGGSAHGVFGSGFDHQHFQTALSLYLYGQRAVGFQVARQQYTCCQQFAQCAADGGGVGFLACDVPPYVFEPDMQAAYRHVVEDEVCAAVGGGGALRHGVL